MSYAKKKATLASKMVGNETHSSFSGRLKGTKNLESMRSKSTKDIFNSKK